MLKFINALTKKLRGTPRPSVSAPSERYAGFDCIYDTPECAIFYKGHDGSDRVIVSFTGIGHALGGIDVQAPEFMRAGQTASVFFVIDKTRSWGNRLDIRAISDVILKRSDGRQITCLGNSMGGFLAILFSPILRPRSVIAFAPQWSISPGVFPKEARWKTYRQAIPEIVHIDLGNSFTTQTQYLVLFGDDRRDQRHYRHFRGIDQCETLKLHACDHNVAAFLKEQGVLYDVIEAWMTGAQVTAILHAKGLEMS